MDGRCFAQVAEALKRTQGRTYKVALGVGNKRPVQVSSNERRLPLPPSNLRKLSPLDIRWGFFRSATSRLNRTDIPVGREKPRHD
jgi:hypothetical protein